ncbi:MAG: hypothetical protein LUD07_12070 [Clostridiales bacterium]|nr:hypothetical protein [Clostridiales bacterium]
MNPVSDGTKGILYRNRYTPDGYYVTETGVWDGKDAVGNEPEKLTTT